MVAVCSSLYLSTTDITMGMQPSTQVTESHANSGCSLVYIQFHAYSTGRPMGGSETHWCSDALQPCMHALCKLRRRFTITTIINIYGIITARCLNKTDAFTPMLHHHPHPLAFSPPERPTWFRTWFQAGSCPLRPTHRSVEKKQLGAGKVKTKTKKLPLFKSAKNGNKGE